MGRIYGAEMVLVIYGAGKEKRKFYSTCQILPFS